MPWARAIHGAIGPSRCRAMPSKRHNIASAPSGSMAGPPALAIQRASVGALASTIASAEDDQSRSAGTTRVRRMDAVWVMLFD